MIVLYTFWLQYMLHFAMLVLLTLYLLLNNVSVDCVICVSTHILHTAVTDSIMLVFLHFYSEENSPKCCHQSCSFRLKYTPNRLLAGA